jgi:hypothetical protein
MRSWLVSVTILVTFAFRGTAQSALDNSAVIKLVKAGLSDDLIISTVNATPGKYDTSADGLIALKAGGASDKVVSAIVLKASSLQPSITPSSPADRAVPGKSTQAPTDPAVQGPVQQYIAPATAPTANKPRVFLQSASKGTNRNAARDQSMEMSKDFERDCDGVRVTINQQMADYTVVLNHIEVGFARDNQIQVANKEGDLLSKTKEGGSIAGGMKKACALIVADLAKK